MNPPYSEAGPSRYRHRKPSPPMHPPNRPSPYSHQDARNSQAAPRLPSIGVIFAMAGQDAPQAQQRQSQSTDPLAHHTPSATRPIARRRRSSSMTVGQREIRMALSALHDPDRHTSGDRSTQSIYTPSSEGPGGGHGVGLAGPHFSGEIRQSGSSGGMDFSRGDASPAGLRSQSLYPNDSSESDKNRRRASSGLTYAHLINRRGYPLTYDPQFLPEHSQPPERPAACAVPPQPQPVPVGSEIRLPHLPPAPSQSHSRKTSTASSTASGYQSSNSTNSLNRELSNSLSLHTNTQVSQNQQYQAFSTRQAESEGGLQGSRVPYSLPPSGAEFGAGEREVPVGGMAGRRNPPAALPAYIQRHSPTLQDGEQTPTQIDYTSGVSPSGRPMVRLMDSPKLESRNSFQPPPSQQFPTPPPNNDAWFASRYPCPQPGCGKGFSRPSSLAIHTRIHTNEQPFLCGKCHRAFSVQSNLKRHQKVHEREAWERARAAAAAASADAPDLDVEMEDGESDYSGSDMDELEMEA